MKEDFVVGEVASCFTVFGVTKMIHILGTSPWEPKLHSCSQPKKSRSTEFPGKFEPWKVMFEFEKTGFSLRVLSIKI